MGTPIRIASLFCGCGGADLGALGGFTYLERLYARLPFNIVFACDNDAHSVATYNENFSVKALKYDVRDVDFESVPDCDLLLAGFPCQPFSTVNPLKNRDDGRSQLYKEVSRFLKVKKPAFFVCENVKGLAVLKHGALIRKIIDEFSCQGYNVQFRILMAAQYGIPQLRERVFIIGIKRGIKIPHFFPQPINELCEAPPLSRVIERLDIPEGKYYFSPRAVRGMRNAKNNMKRGLWQDLDKPCLTITSHLAKASINSRDPLLLVDPSADLYRRFTPREAARIQSFPDTFRLPASDAKSYRQIGNAIPPVLMWHVANALNDNLSGRHKQRVARMEQIYFSLGLNTESQSASRSVPF